MNTINTSELSSILMEETNLNGTTFDHPLHTADNFDSDSIIEKSYNNSYSNEEEVKADLRKIIMKPESSKLFYVKMASRNSSPIFKKMDVRSIKLYLRHQIKVKQNRVFLSDFLDDKMFMESITNGEYELGTENDPYKNTNERLPFVENLEYNEHQVQNFLSNTKKLICNGNNELYEFLLDWIATIIQKPSNPTKLAIILIGTNEDKKNYFTDILCKLFGKFSFYCDCSGKKLTQAYRNNALFCQTHQLCVIKKNKMNRYYLEELKNDIICVNKNYPNSRTNFILDCDEFLSKSNDFSFPGLFINVGNIKDISFIGNSNLLTNSLDEVFYQHLMTFFHNRNCQSTFTPESVKNLNEPVMNSFAHISKLEDPKIKEFMDFYLVFPKNYNGKEMCTFREIYDQYCLFCAANKIQLLGMCKFSKEIKSYVEVFTRQDKIIGENKTKCCKYYRPKRKVNEEKKPKPNHS
ncbi:hypothetical protein QTN25_010674 [Entamoeba marina]